MAIEKNTAIIFDVDGTLWDSRAVCADAWNAVFDAAPDTDSHVDPEILRQEFGKPLPVIAADIIHGVDETRRAELMEQCLQAEDDFLAKYPPEPYTGLEDVLTQLSSAGYPLLIVSNSQAGYIERFLDVTGLGHFFLDHVCHGDNAYSKDRNIRYLMEKHALRAAIYVGDTQADCDATHKAEIPFVHATYGFGTADAPEFTIGDIRELVDVVLG